MYAVVHEDAEHRRICQTARNFGRAVVVQRSLEAWFLREWQRNSPWQILLRPLSWLFTVMAATRAVLYRIGILRVQRVAAMVIVVGNITVGGTGKTPLVLAIVAILARAGIRCGVVTRGYAAAAAPSHDNVQPVTPESQIPGTTSDEAMLLANRSSVPVYASVNRVAAAQTLLADHPEIDVIVCDDGLQHYALGRDIEICVVDGARRFGNGGRLPAGPLRESPSRLRAVDAIVVNRTGSHVASARGDTASLSTQSYSMTLGNEVFLSLAGGDTFSAEEMRAQFSGKRIHAVAGIGNPPRFFAHLSRLGFVLATTTAFPDHHAFSRADFANLDADIILMTEKDAVKCRQFADARMWLMQVDALLPAAFGEFLVNRVAALKVQHVARSKTA